MATTQMERRLEALEQAENAGGPLMVAVPNTSAAEQAHCPPGRNCLVVITGVSRSPDDPSPEDHADA